MNDTALFFAIGTGTIAGIFYGQQLSEHILKHLVTRADHRIRELRCVFCCGRLGSLAAALPTFFLVFFLPHHFNADIGALSAPPEPVIALGMAALAAALLAGSLALGAAVGALTGKGIVMITRETHPASP